MKNKHFYPIFILLLFLAVGIQPTLATINLTDTGWKDENGDPLPADDYLWDQGSLTGTLNTNVFETIQISSSGTSPTDNLILDGAGHTVNLGGSSVYHGVVAADRHYVTIQNLNVTGCAAGITLNPSGYCNVINNTISNCQKGIFMWEAGTCLIEGNTVSNNDTGILIQYGSIYNTLKNNTIENNTVGISITDTSQDNTIYNNNFMNDLPGQKQATVYNDFNLFNLPVAEGGGNYWSNWTSPDNDSDGFVDNPYSMDPCWQEKDYFPWVIENGWLSPELLIEALIVKVEGMNGNYGISNALDAKLQNALDALEAKNAGQRQDAVNKMEAFINAVEAQSGDKIPVEVADELIADAQAIIAML